MSCHRIGLGMNSVVEKSIEMFENEEIGLNACKKIIVACRNGVYWCDGNEDEAIACIIDCYCGNCLRKLHQEHRIRVDRNRYDVVTHYLCEDICSKFSISNHPFYHIHFIFSTYNGKQPAKSQKFHWLFSVCFFYF